jgi:hypothetical protein
MPVSRKFLKERTGTEKPARLKDVFPLHKYRGDEYGKKDNFDKIWGNSSASYYAGKEYGSSTEIVSMGVEELFKSPGHFAEADPEYFGMIVGLLNGELRS